MAGECFRLLRVAVIGTGYVGLTTDVAMAYSRHHVVGRMMARLTGNQAACASVLLWIHGYDSHPRLPPGLGLKVWEGAH